MADPPNDHYYPNSWHHQKIGSESAWAINGGSRSLIVAVIDSGIDANHPELAAHIVPGWNFNNNSTDTSPIGWHGTSVAGVIAATRNNGIGIAGMADVSIMPVIASESPNGMSDFDAAIGIRWAVDHGAKVINISAGLDQREIFHDAATYAWNHGAIVVVASANSDDGGSQFPWPDVISVSASDQDDNRFNSQYGPFLDLLAPGKDIYTTYWDPAGQFNYAIAQGSSFAAPLVSGAAALIWSINPDLTPTQVRDILFSTAHDLNTPGRDLETGWGRLDVGAAAAAAAQTVPEPSIALLILLSSLLLLLRPRPSALS
jgi:subtilisin family serine protease